MRIDIDEPMTQDDVIKFKKHLKFFCEKIIHETVDDIKENGQITYRKIVRIKKKIAFKLLATL